MKYFKKLIGDRIYLSPINSEDAEIYTEWMNDFETTDYTGRSWQTISLEAEKRFLENEDEEGQRFSILDLNNDKIIGIVGLHNINYIHRTAILGIFIGNKDYRDKGYGTEAIRLILDFAFNYLNLNNIKLNVFEFNQRAIKCYEKCGFKKIGARRKANYTNGKYYDVISMDILKEEFKESFIRNKCI